MRRSPDDALAFLEALRKRVSFVQLTPDEYFDAAVRLGRAGIPGAQIYDALLLACARKVNADVIYTWDLRHFRAVAPDLADRIVEP